jgi:membrane-associated phospholipid phosphatase
MAVAAVQRSPDLFAPGFLGRMWARVWPIAAFFALAAPAGMLRAMADDGPIPVRRNFTALEEMLLSTAPTRWLQGSFVDAPETQLAATALYVTWYLVPVTCGAWLLIFRAGDYWRFIAFLLFVYYAAMPFFALYPLEAPWAHDDSVRRHVAEQFPAQAAADPNPYAVMPSLHVALIAAAAFWYGLRTAPGRIVFAYSAVMGLAVVYSGDHYVIDVIAGYALAFAVLLVVRRVRLPVLSCANSPDSAGVPSRRYFGGQTLRKFKIRTQNP